MTATDHFGPPNQLTSGGGLGTTSAHRVMRALTVGPWYWGVLLIMATLSAAWLLAWGTGEATAVSRHWFYVPVVIAAVRLGAVWAVGLGVAAGLLAGPLVPLPDVGVGLTGHGQWIVRTVFFVVIGFLVGVMTQATRHYQQQAVRLAEKAQQVAARERDLAVQRAALIQTVSHELRTPLTIIKGVVETWSHVGDRITITQACQFIPPMQRATQRLEGLVSTVLAAADARGEDQLVPVTVDVATLLSAAIRRASDDPEARARVETAVEVSGTTVTTVPAYVETALGQLVGNALKFSPRDTTVTITARTEDHQLGRLELLVRDRGPGLDEDAVEQLFEPFTQGDQSNTRPHEGLGMGLYTSRKLITTLGGQIDLKPHPEGGTVASVTIPDHS